jgi:hypothetical protein
MPSWQLVGRKAFAAHWRDASGDVVSLTLAPVERTLLTMADTRNLHIYCRSIAESQGAGLVEVAPTVGTDGPCLTYIYKRLRIPAFTFFGVAAIPIPNGTWLWMIVAYERGVTGVREAVVTASLVEAGKLTLESYERSWAQDPYDPSYRGVDRSTLRYLSDAEEYDGEFPNHPLTKVRRELRRLITIPLSPNTAA